MSENNSSSSSSGIGFLGLLQIAFIVLKLCKVIKWSWWLIFIPAYVSVLWFVILLVLIVIATIS